MECGEVQKRLSAYIEGSTSPAEEVLIEEHLKPCQKCRQSLADLKRAIEHVQGLPEVEPPAWLAQRVMASVRSEAEARKGILRVLFYPIRIKLPLEAAAVIAIAVSTIYIFKTMQPTMYLSKEPLERTRPPAISEVAKPPVLPESKAPPAIPKPTRMPAPAPKAERQMPTAELGPAREAYDETLTARPQIEEKAAPPRAELKVSKVEAERAPVPPATAPHDEMAKPKAVPPSTESLAGVGAREESRPQALSALPGEEEAYEAWMKDESACKVLSAAPRAKALTDKAERKGAGLHLTLAVNDIGAATREVEKAILGLGGKILQEQRQEDKTTVLAELSPDQLQTLLKRLKPLGALQGEEAEAETREEGIRIVRLDISRGQ